MNICLKKILVSDCTDGIYLRWWFNGWHHFNFTNGYEIEMKTESMGIQVSQYFSVISKIERDTRIKSEYAYKVTLHGITTGDIAGFTGLLLAEKVEQYELGVWREVDITRGNHIVREEGTNGYILDFEITRKELPNSSSVYQKSLKLYLGDTLCDMDDSEVVPINKQVNNIAEMQDRQSDFTATFKIRKTRAMRSLFELSGEVGATTIFPYERQECKLVQDNIEVITGGILKLNKVDDEYYYVSILSGNANFFNLIEGLKISDLTLPHCVHTWDADFMALTHGVVSPGIDVVYPLCEPSDDGSIAPLTDDGDKVEMYGGWIWPFIRVQTIWEEIFANAGFIVTGGDIIGSDIFGKLYIPIVNRSISDPSKYYYSMSWLGYVNLLTPSVLGEINFPGVNLIKGNAIFQQGWYYAPYSGDYKLSASVIAGTLFTPPATLSVYSGGVYKGAMLIEPSYGIQYDYTFEITGVLAGDAIIISTNALQYYYWFWGITEIKGALIAYGSIVDSRLHLPAMTQIDFVKMVCHLFGLIPDVTPKDKKIRFWNYEELYDNIHLSRDWSAYLSERDDEVEFKFGNYAQNNYLKYKQSQDVITDNGMGTMVIDDETLPEEKDIVQASVSTCDEVRILLNVFPVDTSRIAFNKWNDQDSDYDSNETIDPRVVYIDFCREDTSPLYQKAFWIRETSLPLTPGTFAAPSHEILTPKVAQSLEVSFSNLIAFYANLSRLLTKTNLRRAKFNLPVYEVAGLKHNIPVYLSQYKAYFYVNKVNNYVAGQLCTIDLIKL